MFPVLYTLLLPQLLNLLAFKLHLYCLSLLVLLHFDLQKEPLPISYNVSLYKETYLIKSKYLLNNHCPDFLHRNLPKNTPYHTHAYVVVIYPV